MRIGVDVGGSKIEIAVLGAGGQIVLRERVPAPSAYEGTVRTIAELVTAAETRLGIRATVGIGIPGTISPATGLVKNANSTWLIGKPFDRDLAAALSRRVRLANDANCFTLSEAVDGAGSGHRVVFGIIVGTGAGGGIAVGRHVLPGANAIAGEWGHNPLPWPRADWSESEGGSETPRCYCGKRGCIETYISGPGLAADHARRTGAKLAAEEIADAAVRGEPAAVETMERFYDRFARSLATVINILDPDAVVIGGGLSNIGALYGELPRRLPAFVLSDVCGTPVLRNRHGDSSGVRGAAWLWEETQTR